MCTVRALCVHCEKSPVHCLCTVQNVKNTRKKDEKHHFFPESTSGAVIWLLAIARNGFAGSAAML